jgi:hypothetical protein
VRITAVTGEPRKRAGRGEVREIASVERSAPHEVGNVVERAFSARHDDA